MRAPASAASYRSSAISASTRPTGSSGAVTRSAPALASWSWKKPGRQQIGGDHHAAAQVTAPADSPAPAPPQPPREHRDGVGHRRLGARPRRRPGSGCGRSARSWSAQLLDALRPPSGRRTRPRRGRRLPVRDAGLAQPLVQQRRPAAGSGPSGAAASSPGRLFDGPGNVHLDVVAHGQQQRHDDGRAPAAAALATTSGSVRLLDVHVGLADVAVPGAARRSASAAH